MKFNIGQGGDIQLIINFEDSMDKSTDMLKYLNEKEIFQAKDGELFLDLEANGKGKLYLGLGKKDDLNLEGLRKGFHSVGKKLMEIKAESFGLTIPKIEKLEEKSIISSIVEGLLQSTYAFDKYLSEKKVKPSLKNVYLEVENKDLAKEAIEETEIIFEGIKLTRDLVNERAIKMYPETLAEAAKSELEPLGIKVTVYGESEIKEMNMEAFLAVAEGSDKEAKFITMEYLAGGKDDETIALVGKGLTYDSGGYSLKPPKSMDTMYSDMTGSATVIGTLKALAKAGVKKNVVGIVAACENLVDGSAYKPGDIIGSMSGKTIEVLNTDAEGRLTLADALWYAVDEVKADRVIDIATLTGAVIMAFGDRTTGALTNDSDFLDELLEAAKLSGENIWELPNFPEYKEYFASDFADMANTNTKGLGAGTITAGLFLENFVKETPWIHLDIAGTAYLQSPRGYLPKGATGIHVKTLFNLLNK